MAELTADVIQIVDTIRISADAKQDFYVKWLEAPEPVKTDGDVAYKLNYINKILQNIIKNNNIMAENHIRLEIENEDTIRNLYSYNDVVADPLDVLLAVELEDSIIGNLSELEKDIYSRVQNGLSYETIGEELDMTYKAVQVTMSRIKRKFNAEANGQE